jgi:hypothetical protein
VTTSKLLHAIVGVGIAFGGGTACGGTSTSQEQSPTSQEESPDAGPDVSKFDPFCDAAWPITKATLPPPVCTDPNLECDEFTRLACAKPITSLQCEFTRYSAFCIDGEWACHPDQVDYTECRCFGDAPPGLVCTLTGWMSSSPGG